MIELGESIAAVSEYLTSGAFSGLFRSPVGTAVMITCIIMLIVVSVFQKGALAKTSFYVLLATTFIMFVHNKILMNECSRNARDVIAGTIVDEMVGNGTGTIGAYDTLIVPDLRDL